jgi:glutamyl/glutaminyl-tRNA synthetase
VALCGWNPGSDNEFYSMQDLISSFTLERVNKAGAVFDYQKLNWMNGEYLKQRDAQDLARELHPLLVERGYRYIEPSYVADVIVLVRERVAFLSDVAEFADYLFGDALPPLSDEASALLSGNDKISVAIDSFRKGLSSSVLEDAEAFKGLALQSAEAAGIKMGALLKPLRLVLTHREVGADLFRTVQLLGLDRCLSRLDAFLSPL